MTIRIYATEYALTAEGYDPPRTGPVLLGRALRTQWGWHVVTGLRPPRFVATETRTQAAAVLWRLAAKKAVHRPPDPAPLSRSGAVPPDPRGRRRGAVDMGEMAAAPPTRPPDRVCDGEEPGER